MLINLTPHPLSLLAADGTVVSLPVGGPAPRLKANRAPLGEIEGLPLVRTSLGAVEGLPAPVEGTILIVSALVAEACPDRADLVSPGEAVRDADGKIVGARGLCAGAGWR